MLYNILYLLTHADLPDEIFVRSLIIDILKYEYRLHF